MIDDDELELSLQVDDNPLYQVLDAGDDDDDFFIGADVSFVYDNGFDLEDNCGTVIFCDDRFVAVELQYGMISVREREELELRSNRTRFNIDPYQICHGYILTMQRNIDGGYPFIGTLHSFLEQFPNTTSLLAIPLVKKAREWLDTIEFEQTSVTNEVKSYLSLYRT